jgi:hypothetical protein
MRRVAAPAPRIGANSALRLMLPSFELCEPRAGAKSTLDHVTGKRAGMR